MFICFLAYLVLYACLEKGISPLRLNVCLYVNSLSPTFSDQMFRHMKQSDDDDDDREKA